MIFSSFALQVDFTDSKHRIKLGEVLKPEVTFISLLFPLLLYFKNTKKN